MQDEYYYRQQLLLKIVEFVEESLSDDHQFGYIPDDISKLMADAAFAVFSANFSLNEYFKKEGLLKP